MQQRTKRIYAVALFLDIVGFTDFSEKNDPEIVDDYISFFFDFCSNQIRKNNGWVEKYIGDAICAIFYSSSSTGKDALNACNCAYNILKNVEIFNKENKFPFSIRIGIDAGIVTTTKRDQYDVFVGQAINSASRIQSVAKPNSAYTSKVIAEKSDNLFEFEQIGEFSLKGIDEKVILFSLKDKKNIFNLQNIKNPYFNRKEEVDIIKYLSEKKKIKIAIVGSSGSGKTAIVNKLAVYINKLYKFKPIYIPLNDWEKTTEDLIQRINFALDNIDEFTVTNENRLIIIDNFNCLNFQIESIDFLNKISNSNPIILIYSIDNRFEVNFKELLLKSDFKIFKIEKLSFEEFDNFLQNYFEKPVSATFELKLYNLTEGYIGRAYNILSLLKDELLLNDDQIINIDFDEIFLKREDLLEHCYRINGIDDKMQILLSILAFSYQPLSYDILKEISIEFNYNYLDESLESSKEKGWLIFNDGYFKIANDYLRQFIINSTSKQLKKTIINTLLKITDNLIDKISYILFLYEENEDILENEDDFLSSCIVEIEKQTIENKLILLKKIIKKSEISFFNKILKFILIDRRILPYIFNVLQKEEIEIIINFFNDISHIKEIKSITLFLYPRKNLEKNDLINIGYQHNVSFYLYLIKLLVYPKSIMNNFDEYLTILESIQSLASFKKDYNFIFYFPFYEDKNLKEEEIFEKLNNIFQEDFNFYQNFEKIYFNPTYLLTNKIQLFFILVENISLFIYYKKKPLNFINRMLKLSEKIVLELNIPILIEYYYGLFFYVNFLISNFQYYGIHSKMEFKLLPQLKQINEIIYHIFSFSFDHQEELLNENEILKTSISNADKLFANPPYYIPLVTSSWYLNIIKSEPSEEIKLVNEEINTKIINSIEILEKYKEKNDQIKDFAKIVLNIIQKG